MEGISKLRLFLGIIVFSVGFFSIPNMFLSEKYNLLEDLLPFFFLGSFYILYGGKFFKKEVKFEKTSKENLSKSLYPIIFISITIFVSYKYEEILSSEIVQIGLWAFSVLGILRHWDKDNNNPEKDINKLEDFNNNS